MIARSPEPGVAGAIISILNDPIEAIALARQIDRECGAGTAFHLHTAALALISGQPNENEDFDVLEIAKAS